MRVTINRRILYIRARLEIGVQGELGEVCVKGLFITFEGPEGSGKTTQIKRISEWLAQSGVDYIAVREPGGTRIGDSVRQIVLDPNCSEMAQGTEILLYAASRAQLVEEVIRPALAQGKVVLCDRYIDSSIVYQGYGAMWNLHDILQVNRVATGGITPDRTYLLDIPTDVLERRLTERGMEKDRIEQKDHEYHMRVRQGYFNLAKDESVRYKVINGAKHPDLVFEQILNDLSVELSRFLRRRREPFSWHYSR